MTIKPTRRNVDFARKRAQHNLCSSIDAYRRFKNLAPVFTPYCSIGKKLLTKLTKPGLYKQLDVWELRKSDQDD